MSLPEHEKMQAVAEESKAITVVDWIGDAELDEKEFDLAFGGLGGWFSEGNTWQDYLDSWLPEVHVYAEALRAEILHLGLKRCGDWHQNDPHGTPLFSDGKIASFTMRAWGDLMAAVWSHERPHGYMDFYMECWREEER